MAEQRVAVVTGASSGIGRAIASALVADGFRVFGASRRPPGGAGVDPAGDGGEGEHVTIDVDDDESVRSGVAKVLDAAGHIDLLVNNAGYLCAGAVEEIPVDEAKAQFETNYFGVLRMIRAVLPAMRERGRGHIVTISSLAGLVPVPFWGHYNASKFAIEGLMETLRYEVAPFGIRVAMVEPGSIKTPFYAREQRAGIAAYAGPRGRALGVMADYERKAPGPEVVVRKVVALANKAKPPLRTTVTREARQFTLLRALLPATAFEAGVRSGFKLTGG